MKIDKALNKDVSEIKLLTESCAAHMISQGIFQWNEHYPSAEAFERDIQRGELYKLTQDEKIIGTIVLSNIKDEEYKDIKWTGDDGTQLYIHRLAVHPEYQGKGCARNLMDFADNFALEQGYSWMRLDTFSQNQRNQKFYLARGFKQVGSIYFPKQSVHPFYCYDLPI